MRNATLSTVLSPQEAFCKHIWCKCHGVSKTLYNHIPFTKCFGIKNFQSYKISPTEGHCPSKQWEQHVGWWFSQNSVGCGSDHSHESNFRFTYSSPCSSHSILGLQNIPAPFFSTGMSVCCHLLGFFNLSLKNQHCLGIKAYKSFSPELKKPQLVT